VKELQDRRERFEADLLQVLKAPAGRRFVRGLLSECGFGRVDFTAGEAEANAFREGRRSIGTGLFNSIARLAPKRLPEIMGSNIDER
jgi:hypothetical protein